MRLLTLLAAASGPASALYLPRAEHTSQAPLVQDALYDGHCFYPKPTPHFNLTAYLGTWYQVAGTPFGPTAGARCVTAQYSLNPNGTVKVVNTATIGPQGISIEGTATPVDSVYGAAGTFEVAFPQTPSGAECPGPNYIVQEYCGDHAFVQTQNWSTLYILSRERHPAPVAVDMSPPQAWIDRAVALGSERGRISRFNQTGC
ncbi:Calycin-like protein [Bimuria novae-zelandiae CBS 107.79]|uniref:Calycin-like protein n=1 Tax=Bimuria novae-zelandiae CBS 107.79 TaxID=1447943 RepID=A0A6A5V7B0_9PLEO|nr:Calycin-like protein [Bimuria novae-zelandiae CBS 107.79]